MIWDGLFLAKCRFKSMSKFYIRGADAAVIIFDVTDPKSFVDVSDWILGVVEECQSALGLNTMGIPKILVGNKVGIVRVLFNTVHG